MKYQKGDTVIFKGKKATVTEVMDSYDDGDLAFKFTAAMYDIEYLDGSGGAIVHEKELVQSVIPLSSRVTPKNPFMSNLHGEGWVYEIWDEQKIREHHAETESKYKVALGEAWYRVVFDDEYREEPNEYDENGALISCGGDNAITFTEDELSVVSNS